MLKQTNSNWVCGSCSQWSPLAVHASAHKMMLCSLNAVSKTFKNAPTGLLACDWNSITQFSCKAVCASVKCFALCHNSTGVQADCFEHLHGMAAMMFFQQLVGLSQDMTKQALQDVRSWLKALLFALHQKGVIAAKWGCFAMWGHFPGLRCPQPILQR